jgi:NifU-like protein involved in Fe-S cluster formation
LRASARAPVCGSTLDLGLALDDRGRITRLGIRAHACAIGQASAALFAGSAMGKDRTEIASAYGEIEAWLASGEAPTPAWPGLTAIAAARIHSARHGAILLSWKAALAALP